MSDTPTCCPRDYGLYNMALARAARSREVHSQRLVAIFGSNLSAKVGRVGVVSRWEESGQVGLDGSRLVVGN